MEIYWNRDMNEPHDQAPFHSHLPIFCLSFLIIYGNDSQNDSAKISLDWDEWDDLVKVVRKYRNEWEWK